MLQQLQFAHLQPSLDESSSSSRYQTTMTDDQITVVHTGKGDDDKDAGSCTTNERKRKLDVLNESSTIADLAAVDASTYIQWVNRQSQALPSVFVADPSSLSTASAITTSAVTRNEEVIDGSAATLQVLLSDQMAIRPPPTARHLPPSNATAKSGNINNNNCECSQWVSNTVANFSALRSQLEQSQSRMTTQQRNVAVPPMKDRAAWHVFCLGKEEADGNIGGYFQYNDDDEEEEEEDLFLNEVKVERDDDANDLTDRLNGKSVSNDLQMQQQSDSDTKGQDHNESSVEPNSNTTTTTTTTTTTQTNTTTAYNPNHVPLN
eukprot:scaffold41757_cov47-Cyclotella_meneghiniana.AAC.1